MQHFIKALFFILITSFSSCNSIVIKDRNIIYVEYGKNGNGSTRSPFGSIQKAIDVAVENKRLLNRSSEIIIKDGIYREKITATDSAFSDVPIIIRAQNPGKVIISGSVSITNWKSGKEASWTQNTSKTNVYVASLSDEIIQKLTKNPINGKYHPDGKVPNPWGGYLTDNGMFCNGLLKIDTDYYFPLLAADNLIPGSFSIDYTRKLIFVKLKAKIRNYKSIELGLEPTILRISKQSNLTISGIQFIHAGWALHDAVKFENIKNLHLENCAFNNNRYAGLQMQKIEKGQIINCEANHNGGTGATGSWEGYLRDVTFDGFKANYNNWIGAHFDFTGWAPCGVKWTAVRNLVIRNSEFNSNYAAGLWIDCENRQVTVENSEARDNIGVGIFIKASKGPFVLNNCRYINNLRGIYVSCSENVLLDQCIIKDNDYQFVIFDHWGKGIDPGLFEYDFKEYGTGALWESHAVNAVVKNSVLANRERSDVPFYNELFNDSIGYRNFISTLTTQKNQYFTDFPEKAFYFNKQHYTFDHWQSLFTQDQGSVLKSANLYGKEK